MFVVVIVIVGEACLGLTSIITSSHLIIHFLVHLSPLTSRPLKLGLRRSLFTVPRRGVK